MDCNPHREGFRNTEAKKADSNSMHCLIPWWGNPGLAWKLRCWFRVPRVSPSSTANPRSLLMAGPGRQPAATVPAITGKAVGDLKTG